jgi:hypothetical protein
MRFGELALRDKSLEEWRRIVDRNRLVSHPHEAVCREVVLTERRRVRRNSTKSLIARLRGAIRDAEASSRNEIRYSQASDRYSVIVFFATHTITAPETQFEGFVQVDGGLARARVVTRVSVAAAIARY